MKLFDFAYCGNYEKKIAQLSSVCPEKWSFGANSDNVILKNYIEHTFMKVADEGKILENKENQEKEYALKRYYNVDLLIIDEAFDKDKVSLYKSGFQLPYLDSFLRNRFEMKNKSIFFISNIKPSDIAKYGFGISLQDFVERNTRGSQLFFSDRYVDNAGVMDPNSLFKSLK